MASKITIHIDPENRAQSVDTHGDTFYCNGGTTTWWDGKRFRTRKWEPRHSPDRNPKGENGEAG